MTERFLRYFIVLFPSVMKDANSSLEGFLNFTYEFPVVGAVLMALFYLYLWYFSPSLSPL
jgi:hypothetical protein